MQYIIVRLYLFLGYTETEGIFFLHTRSSWRRFLVLVRKSRQEKLEFAKRVRENSGDFYLYTQTWGFVFAIPFLMIVGVLAGIDSLPSEYVAYLENVILVWGIFSFWFLTHFAVEMLLREFGFVKASDFFAREVGGWIIFVVVWLPALMGFFGVFG